MSTLAESNRARFESLMAGLGEKPAVSREALENFLFGWIDPKTGMPASKVGAHEVKPDVADVFQYTDKERTRILTVAEANLQRIMALPVEEHPFLIASGGGPGVGKTTMLFMIVAEKYNIQGLSSEDWAQFDLAEVVEKVFLSEGGAPVAVVAADRKALLQLAFLDEATTDEAFYKANRSATNFLSLFELDVGFVHRKSIVWDTTLASIQSLGNLEYAKEKGYQTIAVLQGTPLDIRQGAVDARAAGGFYQCLPSNVVDQDTGFGKNVPQIILHTDNILVTWREGANQTAQICAFLSSDADGQKAWYIAGSEDFTKFRTLYPGIDEMPPVPKRSDLRQENQGIKLQIG